MLASTFIADEVNINPKFDTQLTKLRHVRIKRRATMAIGIPANANVD